MFRTISMIALVPLAAFAATPAVAQLPPPGSHAISFTIPSGGGGSFGYRTVRSANSSLGWNLTLDGSWSSPSPLSSSSRSWRVGVGPDMRLYRSGRGPVRPFLYWAANVFYGGGSSDTWSTGLGGGVGLGAEWFVAHSVSVSGATGIRAAWTHSHDVLGSTDTFGLGTFASSIALNLYF